MRIALLLLSSIFLFIQPTQVRSEELVDQVKKSIKLGIRFLRNKAGNNGNWELGSRFKVLSGGTTSLVVVALINSGVKRDDPIIKKALDFLRTIKPTNTYVVGLQTMAFALARDPGDKVRIERNLQWLKDAFIDGTVKGWYYTAGRNGRGGTPDHSINQYALLGIHEALRAGFKFDETILKKLREYYNDPRHRGTYGYRSARVASLTMTSAGLCNLIITGQDLQTSKSILQNDGSAQNCGEYDEVQNVKLALKYLADAYPGTITKTDVQTSRFARPFYCFYGIERAGRLTGQRFFGAKDWYRIGCKALVESQNSDSGAWGGGGFRQTYGEVISTSFALLFLSKGRTPVLISKLAFGQEQFGSSEDWNYKRDDMRHLVEFASQELYEGEPLAWQVYDIRNIKDSKSDDELVEELLPSPIVYISGHQLDLTDRHIKILKKYVENGGFIFAEACCADPRFQRSFEKAIEKIVPGGTLKELNETHGVWTASGKFNIKGKPFPLHGVEQGCKTVVIYNPGLPVMSGYWNKNLKDAGMGRKAFETAANVIAYATGMELPKPRLSTVTLVREGEKVDPPRGHLQVVQLKHPGDWEPAPKAMQVLMSEMGKLNIQVNAGKKDLSLTNRNLFKYKFFYMHGRGKFTTPQKEFLVDLKFTLERGGVLLADAACGSPSFDKSFRKLIETLWPEKKLEPIRVEDAVKTDGLFSREINGEPLRLVRYRGRDSKGNPMKKYQDGPPQLEGLKINGRWAVIYSKFDIGCALEKHNSTTCVGYDHESAKKLGRAVVMYTLRR